MRPSVLLRGWKWRVAAGAAAVLLGGSAAAFTNEPAAAKVTVYKDPNCGCCGRWVEHLRQNGFEVVARDTSDVDAIKKRYGVPDSLASCHTGIVGGYVIEGHVPAEDVARLLEEKPRVVGVAVPGMPIGSPGMEGARRDRYRVVSFDRRGGTTVFATH
ncbi:MAG: DUF411 domain-containing protein [Gemmatimonadaceae bacterium]